MSENYGNSIRSKKSTKVPTTYDLIIFQFNKIKGNYPMNIIWMELEKLQILEGKNTLYQTIIV